MAKKCVDQEINSETSRINGNMSYAREIQS